MGKTTDIREAVEAELEFDPLVDPSDITVKNITGQVALNGTVPSYPQYLEAAAAAQRVAGVTDVHNHLEVLLPDVDYRDDAMLTTAANNALAVNVTVPDGRAAVCESLVGDPAHETSGCWRTMSSLSSWSPGEGTTPISSARNRRNSS